jgi:hypothetical protein
MRYRTVGVGTSGVYTSTYNRVERVYNTTIANYSCPDGYNLS